MKLGIIALFCLIGFRSYAAGVTSSRVPFTSVESYKSDDQVLEEATAPELRLRIGCDPSLPVRDPMCDRPGHSGARAHGSATTPTTPAPTKSNTKLSPEEMCMAAANSSDSACSTPEEVQTAMMFISGAVQQGDIRSACSKMTWLSGISAAMSAVFAQRCGSKSGACITACTEAVGVEGSSTRSLLTLEHCKDNKNKSYKAYIQAGLTGYSSILNKKCADMAGNNKTECDTYDKIAKNPLCPGYCLYTVNKDNPQCNCENASNAQTSYCRCKLPENKNTELCAFPTPNIPNPTNPFNPIPGGIGTSPNIPTSAPIANLEEDIDGGIEQGYNGNSGTGGGKTAPNYEGQGGGGVSALGGGPGMGSGGGAGGAAPGPYNTDITKGYTSGGGAGAVGGGGYGGGAPTAASGYGGKDGKGEGKFDWKSLLPKADKNRGPAGVDPELYNNGITAANGLTNFEKVTRKMNEKRPTLLP